METRKLKKEKQEIVPGPSFEQVTVKEEPDEAVNYVEEGTASTSRKRTKAARSTNTYAKEALSKSAKQRQKLITNRSTQVNPEEIDAWCVQKSHEDRVPGENKPIHSIDNEPIEPQCRFCLRRVSFENLKIISNEHKSKAMVAFQLKIFPRDAYPYACINCLNLMDILIDFKSSVMTAKKLLLTKRIHLECDGWDADIVAETFIKCKAAVERHRMEIDAVDKACFEVAQQGTRERHRMPEDTVVEERVELIQHGAVERQQLHKDAVVGECVELIGQGVQEGHRIQKDTVVEERAELTQHESTKTITLDNSCNEQVEDNLEKSENDIVEVLETIELEYDETDHPPNDERIEDNVIMRDESNPELVFEEIDESDSSSSMEPDDNWPSSSKQTVRPVKYYQEPDIPAGLQVMCEICGETMLSQTLESHKNRHFGIKPYTCPISGCGFMFHSRANMATHMRRMHAANGREEHKCDICGIFVRGQPGCLNVHKKRHTNERKYVCNLCGKGFTMTAYLRQHKLSHSEEFPHQCRYCGKKFNIKYSMRTHERMIHEKNNHVPQS